MAFRFRPEFDDGLPNGDEGDVVWSPEFEDLNDVLMAVTRYVVGLDDVSDIAGYEIEEV